MKTFSTALVMGLCGATAVFVSFSLAWPTWVMFIAWVGYYIFGRTIKTAAISFLQVAMGIALGILIQTLGHQLTSLAGRFGLPLAVFILIGSLAYVSKIRLLGNIPAWFLGLIIFFGVHPRLEPLPLLSLFVPIIAGFAFAIINDFGVKLITRQHHTTPQ